jgi:hypothetical protein
MSSNRSQRTLYKLLLPLLAMMQAMSGCSDQHIDANNMSKGTTAMSTRNEATKSHGYASVNGLKMYYEIEGSGDPLVYVPPAFGFAGQKPIPALVQGHSLITVDQFAFVSCSRRPTVIRIGKKLGSVLPVLTPFQFNATAMLFLSNSFTRQDLRYKPTIVATQPKYGG